MLAQFATNDLTQDTTWQQFSVDYSFPVSFTEDLFAIHNPTLLNAVTRLEASKQHRLCVFIDKGVIDSYPDIISALSQYVAAHSDSLSLAGHPTPIESGEAVKSNHHSVLNMHKVVAQHHIDRHSFIVGIGGGALLDAVGLVAATAHRGIRHIRIPTTVLSQNDSGVGVKNGINYFDQKNYMGTFAPPFAVLNDYRFIECLPERDKIAGMAEAVKVALIRDKPFFQWLESNATALSQFQPAAMQYMIRRCAELHMQQIGNGGDPFESGSTRPLDFGHWSAHRLEALSNYSLRHGEAVAIGIALDARYSVLSGFLSPDNDNRICHLLETLGFILWHPVLNTCTNENRLEVVRGLKDFQEHLGGELSITLLQNIGSGFEVHEMDEQRVSQAIGWLNSRQRQASTNVRCIQTDLLQRQGTQSSPKAQEFVLANSLTSAADELNIELVNLHLRQWLANRLSRSSYEWLHQRLLLITQAPTERDLHITLGLIPRKLSRDDLNLSQQELDAAQVDCGRQWNPRQWSIDTAARCLVICTLQQHQSDTFEHVFTDLCKSADLNESIAFYRSISVLPQSTSLDKLIGSGLRTHINAIFEAIAHDNPYPELHFSENRWNHMILKTLFIDSRLRPIQGIDARANAELASILCDYAHERWAASRPVAPELWRCVGPFAKDQMLEDLHRALGANDPLEQQAGLMALMTCPLADHDVLRSRHPLWSTMIDSGEITWERIGSSYGSN